jgi:hypothetical protein
MSGMNQGLDELYKILKDETRSKIIALLNQRGSLSYTDLKDALQVSNTGPLNYHLKTLGDLIAKNASGHYTLTERGKLAANLLSEFRERQSQFQLETSFFRLPKWLLIAGGIISAALVVGFFGLYLRGLFDFSRFTINSLIVLSVYAVFLFADGFRRLRSKWSPNRQMNSNAVWFVVFGGFVGMCILLIGGSLLLTAVESFIQSTGVEFTLFPFRWWTTFCFTGGPLFGGLAGYLYFKKSRFSKKNYYDSYA